MRASLFMALLSLCLVFGGCPYETAVPIDNPSVKINPKLLGAWKSIDDSKSIYKVTQQDEFTYDISVSSSSPDKTENYSAYTSLINGVSFLNIWNKGDDVTARKYYLCKIELKSEGILRLSEVSDNITEQFVSGKDLKQFIASNMKYSYFFNKKELTFIDENQIIALSKDKIINETRLGKSKLVISIMIAALVLVLIVSIFLWLHITNKRQTEKLIFEKKEFAAMLHGQDKERKRIAADLHDRLGSMLSTVKVYFNALEEFPGQLKNENKELYQKANILLDDACEEVRRISHDLASDVLVNSGLLVAVNKLKDTISATNQINICLYAFGLEKRLERDVEIAAYNIIQELISNILNHSRATEATIQLHRHENALNIVVEDNGIGFHASPLIDKAGMGLKNISTRVLSLKGKFSVDTRKGAGTTMIVDIPI